MGIIEEVKKDFDKWADERICDHLNLAGVSFSASRIEAHKLAADTLEWAKKNLDRIIKAMEVKV